VDAGSQHGPMAVGNAIAWLALTLPKKEVRCSIVKR
jgi:hypothetical protein